MTDEVTIADTLLIGGLDVPIYARVSFMPQTRQGRLVLDEGVVFGPFTADTDPEDGTFSLDVPIVENVLWSITVTPLADNGSVPPNGRKWSQGNYEVTAETTQLEDFVETEELTVTPTLRDSLLAAAAQAEAAKDAAETVLEDAEDLIDFTVGDEYNERIQFKPEEMLAGAGMTAAAKLGYNTSDVNSGRWTGWAMDLTSADTDLNVMISGFILPTLWEAFHVDVLWIPTTAAAGNVAWRLLYGGVVPGGVLAGAAPVINDAVAAVGTQNQLHVTRVATGVPVDAADEMQTLTMRRRGTDTTNDTYAGITVMHAVRLTRSA